MEKSLKESHILGAPPSRLFLALLVILPLSLSLAFFLLSGGGGGGKVVIYQYEHDKEGTNVVASVFGEKYYYPWCGGVERISPQNRILFGGSGAAERAGYDLAKNCKGPI